MMAASFLVILVLFAIILVTSIVVTAIVITRAARTGEQVSDHIQPSLDAATDGSPISTLTCKYCKMQVSAAPNCDNCGAPLEGTASSR